MAKGITSLSPTRISDCHLSTSTTIKCERQPRQLFRLYRWKAILSFVLVNLHVHLHCLSALISELSEEISHSEEEGRLRRLRWKQKSNREDEDLLKRGGRKRKSDEEDALNDRTEMKGRVLPLAKTLKIKG